MQFLIAGTFAVISLVGVASQCDKVCTCTRYQQDGFTVENTLILPKRFLKLNHKKVSNFD
jgi:hypothetical protein